MSDITIRHWAPDDYEALYEIHRQPRAIRGTLQMPAPSLEMWRQRAQAHSDGHYRLIACIDDKPVGALGLMRERSPRRNHVAGIGMAVHDQYTGRGVGSRLMEAALDLADNWLALRRVELEVFVDNEPAIRLYRRCGFIEEGRFTDHAFRAGEYVDVLAMARLKPPVTGTPTQ